MISIVEENMEGFTDHQVKKAKLARKIYHNIGMPTVKNFKLLIKMNAIRNCPITTDDINNTEKIFGPSISSLKGKSTRTKPKIVTEDNIEIPQELIKNNKDIELCMDTMYINKIGMLTMIDKTIKFRSLVPIKNKSQEEYYRAIDVILRKYNSAGFNIK